MIDIGGDRARLERQEEEARERLAEDLGNLGRRGRELAAKGEQLAVPLGLILFAGVATLGAFLFAGMLRLRRRRGLLDRLILGW